MVIVFPLSQWTVDWSERTKYEIKLAFFSCVFVKLSDVCQQTKFVLKMYLPMVRWGVRRSASNDRCVAHFNCQCFAKNLRRHSSLSNKKPRERERERERDCYSRFLWLYSQVTAKHPMCIWFFQFFGNNEWTDLGIFKKGEKNNRFSRHFCPDVLSQKQRGDSDFYCQMCYNPEERFR